MCRKRRCVSVAHFRSRGYILGRSLLNSLSRQIAFLLLEPGGSGIAWDMLRIIQQTSAAAAKSYYRAADYYTEGQELAGRWGGRAAARLGLEVDVAQAAFDALCDNRNPTDGGPLTPRTKEARRVGYDINWHVPKSVSILYGLSGDARILDAFRTAVDETMRELERDALTRVRRNGADETRSTGNLVWAEFVHTTARPVDGVPDPHLHAHCFVFNATFDSEEQRWKAIDLGAIKRDAPYFEAAFHARLAAGLVDAGFGIERSATGWEIAGVPRALIPAFSRRTAQIEAIAAAEHITDPEARAAIGAKTRAAKVPELGVEKLRARWQERLTPDDRAALDEVLTVPVATEIRTTDPNRAAMAFAVEHCFERNSVVSARALLTAALKRGVGEVSVEGVTAELGGHGLLLKDHEGQRLATTRGAIEEERQLLRFAREGRGTYRPLGGYGVDLGDSGLDAGQQRAAELLLGSRDTVTLLRGAAGTGKTTLMRATVAAIEKTGKRVVPLAPSAEASRGVLRAEGFATAETVARFLVDEQLQQQAREQVLWVDEAGLLGSRTLAKLFATAERLQARVVLAGDRRQHTSVERGAVLRLLETNAGLVPAEITVIRRQQGDYKHAVAALAEGDVAGGFDRLDRLGWVHAAPDGERESLLAVDYSAAIAAGKTALVVSPTHAEGQKVTDAIRAELKARGTLGRDERTVMRLHDAGLTSAERSDPVNYRTGDVVEFHQHAAGFVRGQRYRVAAVEDKQVLVRDAAGVQKALPLALPERFGLYHAGELALAAGDRVRVTKNVNANGRRFTNGALHTVTRFTPAGDAVLDNGRVLARDFGHLQHGYVVTSHAAQGKTVDRVFIAQSSASFPASSREQFYVSASRARERLTLYTDDKSELRRAVARSDPRPAAVELMGDARRSRRVKWLAHLRRLASLAQARASMVKPPRVTIREKEIDRE